MLHEIKRRRGEMSPKLKTQKSKMSQKNQNVMKIRKNRKMKRKIISLSKTRVKITKEKFMRKLVMKNCEYSYTRFKEKITIKL